MATKVVMEALSPTMEEGRLVKWHKAEGEAVHSGDVLAEVETDKAIMELVARGDGVMRKQLLAEGATAPVGQLVAIVAEPAEIIDALLPAQGAATATSISPPPPPPPSPAAAAPPLPSPTPSSALAQSAGARPGAPTAPVAAPAPAGTMTLTGPPAPPVQRPPARTEGAFVLRHWLAVWRERGASTSAESRGRDQTDA